MLGEVRSIGIEGLKNVPTFEGLGGGDGGWME